MLHATHPVADYGEKAAVSEESVVFRIGETERILLGMARSNVLRVAGQNAHSFGHVFGGRRVIFIVRGNDMGFPSVT
jgi:hypothetical protein